MLRAVNSRVWLLAAAAASLILFLLLGYHVTHRGEPSHLVVLETALLNHSTLVGWWLTWACYPLVLGPIGLGLLVVAWRFPQWRGRVVWSLVTLLLCWLAADVAQHFFARPRRLDWVVKQEHSFSFPSSHAAIATGFYGLWAWLIATSDLRWRKLIVCLLVILIVAICWSRLALGAHYITDLLGGIFLAGAIVFAGAWAVRR